MADGLNAALRLLPINSYSWWPTPDKNLQLELGNSGPPGFSLAFDGIMNHADAAPADTLMYGCQCLLIN